jgi:hypothetical protein
VSWLDILSLTAIVAAVALLASSFAAGSARSVDDARTRRWLGVGLLLVMGGQFASLRFGTSLVGLVVAAAGVVVLVATALTRASASGRGHATDS